MNRDSDADETSVTTLLKRRKWPRNIMAIIGLCLILGGTGFVWTMNRGSTPPADENSSTETIRSALQVQAAPLTAAPLYYPAQLPSGFRMQPSSVGLYESEVVHFTLISTDGKQITVTEQPRPPLTEELTKTKEFTTPIGNAYLANLEGKIAGFIFTDKTLIILNSLGGATPKQLEQTMRGMKNIETN